MLEVFFIDYVFDGGLMGLVVGVLLLQHGSKGLRSASIGGSRCVGSHAVNVSLK